MPVNERATQVIIDVATTLDEENRLNAAAIDVETQLDAENRLNAAMIDVETQFSPRQRLSAAAIMIEWRDYVPFVSEGVLSTGDEVLTSIQTSLFIQFEPGREVYYLGTCASLDEIPNPRTGYSPIVHRSGIREYIIGTERPTDPPGLIKFTIDRLHAKTVSWLDSARCPFTVFALQRCTGPEGKFDGWIAGMIVQNCKIINDPLSNIQQRKASDEILHAYDIVGFPPRLDLYEVFTSKLSISEPVIDANCITAFKDTCPDSCEPCQNIYIGCDAGIGVTANVKHSHDWGATWIACPTDPFAIGIHIRAIKSFRLDANTERIIVFRGPQALTFLQCSYSDNLGDTWSGLVDIGVTTSEGVISPNALFIFDRLNMWVGTDGGRIYHSKDGGLIWDEQPDALIKSTGNDIYGVQFLSSDFGVAVGTNSLIIQTRDGGVNWVLITPPTGAGITYNDIQVFSTLRWLIGASNGYTYITYDGGASWAQLSNFSLAGSGGVKGLDFVNDQVGFMICRNTVGIGYIFRTIDGGFSWIRADPHNGLNGLNEVIACNINSAFAVGDDDGNAVVLKVDLV